MKIIGQKDSASNIWSQFAMLHFSSFFLSSEMTENDWSVNWVGRLPFQSWTTSGWPDEFARKVTQNVAQPIFCHCYPKKWPNKFGLLLQSSKNCPMLTTAQWTKIRPIWSPCGWLPFQSWTHYRNIYFFRVLQSNQMYLWKNAPKAEQNLYVMLCAYVHTQFLPWKSSKKWATSRISKNCSK
jgi:hypothetical protein